MTEAFKKYDNGKAQFDMFPPEINLPPIEGRGPLVHAYQALVRHDMPAALRHLVEVIGDTDVARGYVELVMAYGVAKYGQRDNWRLCTEPDRYRHAAMRHVLALSYGEARDQESGLPHVSHALCSVVLYLVVKGGG